MKKGPLLMEIKCLVFEIVYQATVSDLYLGLTAPTFKGRQSYNKKNCILETLTLYMCAEKNIVSKKWV